MILSIPFKPVVKIGKIYLDTYWIIVSAGALLLLVTGLADLHTVSSALLANSAVNPLKILVLFISMTLLSVFLDELGFFRYLANVTLKRAKTSQTKLFLYLYLIVSVLTVFTSNDVIILSFTPFICYFAKNARIDPLPYLAAEFVAANTWSMMLIIGNPTNIYLATANGIDFLSYIKVMLLPTLCAGTVAFAALYLLFKKKLKTPISGEPVSARICDKPLLVVGLVHLSLCTLILAISSYVHIEMWMVSLGSVISLFVITSIIALKRKKVPQELLHCLKRAPWELIPFVLGMFVLIISLSSKGVTDYISNFLGNDLTVFKYGFLSLFSANVINNIPMSVLFSSIIDPIDAAIKQEAVYATVIGSNIGAFLTPIGALAGILWSSILNQNGLKFGYKDFLKIGVTIALPTAAVALLVLWLVL
jgi:arsenical pump membrane protein